MSDTETTVAIYTFWNSQNMNSETLKAHLNSSFPVSDDFDI